MAQLFSQVTNRNLIMPDLFYLISKWWKQIALLVAICSILVLAILMLQPKKYLSQATALPANSALSDKARVFNNNIEALYSSLGSPDELDMIVGTAQLDTIYLFQADSFSLATHYKINGANARMKAAKRLHKHTQVTKSGYGELKVKVWDNDRHMSAQLANAIMQKLQSMHQALINENNVSTLASLRHSQQLLMANPDSNSKLPAWKQAHVIKQLEQYEELINEYSLMADSRPLALLTIENARPAIKPDKPRIVAIMLATVVLSLIFAILSVLLIEKSRKPVA